MNGGVLGEEVALDGEGEMEADPWRGRHLDGSQLTVTLIYPPAGVRQGRPKVRTHLAEIDDTQEQLYDALRLQALAPV